ncbi:class I SAM-dependent methyltransferase [Methylobacterium komagatae]|uniref:Class I SAM-dependent methyltransferase n=1 Tax=Methylobacterium komagatae TaxID=374425 RepID=A0ABW2BPR0_9HYPH
MANLFKLLSKIIRAGESSPELDLAFYRLVNDDLANFDDKALIAHYERHGRSEGRLANPAAERRGFIALVPEDADVLEIGPFTKPTLRGPRVHYFDVMDRAGLLARAVHHAHPTDDCPEIEFVSPTGDLNVVDRQFDIVLSSHCIEHQPDLVAHLQQVERILRPNGRYMLLIPDKRYCFDALLPESTVDAVLQAHREKRRVHTWASVREHRALTTHNDTARHWAGDSADPRGHLFSEREHAARVEFDESNGNYIDVHAWQFTPSSFRNVVATIRRTKLMNLTVEHVYDTPHGSNEFTAILHKSRNGTLVNA